MAGEKAGKKYLVFLSLFTAFLSIYIYTYIHIWWLEKTFSSWIEGQHDSLIPAPEKLSQLDRSHTFPLICSSTRMSLTLHSYLNSFLKTGNSEDWVELPIALRLCQYHWKVYICIFFCMNTTLLAGKVPWTP